MERYTILKDVGVKGLMEKVNALMDEDPSWVPQGGITEKDSFGYKQAMFRPVAIPPIEKVEATRNTNRIDSSLAPIVDRLILMMKDLGPSSVIVTETTDVSNYFQNRKRLIVDFENDVKGTWRLPAGRILTDERVTVIDVAAYILDKGE